MKLSKILIFLTLLSCQPLANAADNDVEVLTAEEVGRYAPEQTPKISVTRTEIVRLTNDFRIEQDRSELSRSELLDTTAQKFAEYMAETDRYGHTADGREPNERTKAEGYKHCQVAENIGYFFRTVGFTSQELAESSVQGWINSPGHRENMLLEFVTEIGVGVAQSEKTNVFYAVQLFGRPRNLMINFSVANRTEEEIFYKLGDKKFLLQPRYTRTHGICQPQKIKFDEGESSKSYIPKSQDEFTLTPGKEAFEVEVSNGSASGE